jgi:hypothetical protein
LTLFLNLCYWGVNIKKGNKKIIILSE